MSVIVTSRMSTTTQFGGDTKVGTSLLGPLEQRLIRWTVPRLPSWLRSHHLVLVSIPISVLIIVCSYLAKFDSTWLWAVSSLILLQWLTDSLDGALGHFRKEGLIRWGYYMDHLLDYFFLASILIGYMLLLPDHFKYLQFFVLTIFAGFMVNSFLAMAATNTFRVSYFGVGPTEVRLLFVLINSAIFFFGKTYLGGTLPYVLALSFVGLILVIYQTQKILWQEDIQRKRQNDEK